MKVVAQLIRLAPIHHITVVVLLHQRHQHRLAIVRHTHIMRHRVKKIQIRHAVEVPIATVVPVNSVALSATLVHNTTI